MQRRRATLLEYDAEIFGNGEGFEHAWREAVSGGRGGSMASIHVLLQICAMSSSIQRLLWAIVAAFGVVLAWACACAIVGIHEVSAFVTGFTSEHVAPWMRS